LKDRRRREKKIEGAKISSLTMKMLLQQQQQQQ